MADFGALGKTAGSLTSFSGLPVTKVLSKKVVTVRKRATMTVALPVAKLKTKTYRYVIKTMPALSTANSLGATASSPDYRRGSRMFVVF